MNKLKPWTVTGHKKLLTTHVFDVVDVHCLSPKDGLEKTFVTLRCPEWVNVIPITEKGEVILVNQFRHGTGEFSLELPGGVSEPGQSTLETARRELMEETGYSSHDITLLCSIRPNPALFGNFVHTYLAKNVTKTGQTDFDENEDIDQILVPLEKLKSLVLDGAITHALMVAGLGYFFLTLDKSAK
ncbi:MAG: NUDIX hydrolase [Deltaproteobacteria bacterium]|jgi:8-oxo-dGTP pyrophosphatase MutT (NUDIX family)|nr:NUDIX hydrolase [Deltaproteobacteria bacterium]